MDFDFDQNLYLGFKLQSWPASITRRLPISTSAFEAAGDYAGSSHIFEMGRHFDAYVADEWEAPEFSPITGFPPHLFFDQLLDKARAAGVTGNIGETLSGIVATETLGCNAAEVAHLVVRSKQKTPDFLIRKTTKFESVLKSLQPISKLNLPEWWLVESKIRSGVIDNQGIQEGLIQLATIWFDMRHESEEDVGYGIVIGTGLHPKREIGIHVFMPQNEARRVQLVSFIKSLPTETKVKSSLVKQLLPYLA